MLETLFKITLKCNLSKFYQTPNFFLKKDTFETKNTSKIAIKRTLRKS